MKKMTQRQRRVAELIKESVADALSQGVTKNPFISKMINISDVYVSPDLRHAKVFFSCFDSSGSESSDVREMAKALNAEAYMFQKDMGRKLTLKYIPRVSFQFDDSYERAARMEHLLQGVRR